MVERWAPKPGAPVGQKEPIGRRCFDEPALVGARDQKPKEYLDYRHFEERRTPVEVSFDRLGEKSVDKRVLTFVAPLAKSQGRSLRKHKEFSGWAHVSAELLARPPRGTAFPVVPSPISPDHPEAEDHNSYHAHAIGPDPHSVALHLQYLFSKHGRLQECPPERKSTRLEQAMSLGVSLLRWLLGTRSG